MSQCTQADQALAEGGENCDPVIADAGAIEVSMLLGSWQSATERLEAAHQAACDEVRRLRDELAAKDAELAERRCLAELGDMVAQAAQQMLDRLAHVQRQFDLLQLRLVNDPGGKSLTERLASDLAAWEVAVHDLIGLASQRQPDTDLLSVRELVNGARTALTHQLAERAVHVVVDVPEETRTTGDQRLLQRAIINLVLEALDQAPRGTELLVAATEGLKATEVEIACDSRPGGDPSPAPSETDESATALRWAVVHRIVQQHGGEAVAKEGGARYLLRIPHVQAGVQPSG